MLQRLLAALTELRSLANNSGPVEALKLIYCLLTASFHIEYLAGSKITGVAFIGEQSTCFSLVIHKRWLSLARWLEEFSTSCRELFADTQHPTRCTKGAALVGLHSIYILELSILVHLCLTMLHVYSSDDKQLRLPHGIPSRTHTKVEDGEKDRASQMAMKNYYY